MFVWQGAFVCDMILLYMMNTSSYYRERKFERINFKYGSVAQGFFPFSVILFTSMQAFLFFLQKRGK